MSEDLHLQRAVVTGGAGFIGSHLTAALVDAGCEPLILDRCAPAADPAAATPRWLQTDLRDRRALAELFASERPDAVFHLAGTLCRGNVPGIALECVEVNVAAAVAVLEAATEQKVGRIVLMGSAEEYGDQPGPQSETLAPAPKTLYGASKAAATRFARMMHERLDCPVVSLRPYSVYGPRQPASMFVAEAVDCAVRNLPFRMTSGRQRRDLVYVGDVVAAMMAAARTPGVGGETINVGSGDAHRLRDVAELIWKLAGSTARLEIGAREAGAGELVDTWADVSRAHALLGWRPKVSLEEGLRATIESARLSLQADAAPAVRT